MQSEKVTLTVKELAEILGVSLPKAYELTHIEGFPVILVGKKRIIHKAHFLRWLEESTGKAVM